MILIVAQLLVLLLTLPLSAADHQSSADIHSLSADSPSSADIHSLSADSPSSDFNIFGFGKADRSFVRFAYGVDFDMNFDNREFYRSNFSKSMTIFGARLTPTVGIVLEASDDVRHRVMIGIDVMKDFGASAVAPELVSPASVPLQPAGLAERDETSQKQHNLNLFREITLYYMLEKDLGKTDLELYAGIFPRKATEGRYSQAFFSDSLKFYDNNLEGLLLKFRRPKAYFEVGCDWMGQYGQSRREKFVIFTSGEGEIAPVLKMGYSAYMYHFAGSKNVYGVVDNVLINPYARFDLGRQMGLEVFSLRFGWLQGIQNDRRNIGTYTTPYGGEFDVEIRNWNFGLRGSMFYGMDMMPYYDYSDAGGFKYGNRLYFGDPFYRVHDDGTKGAGMYDRLELFWNPSLSEFLSIKVGAMFHFHDFHYSGCQQVVRLCFNLNHMTDRKRL